MPAPPDRQGRVALAKAAAPKKAPKKAAAAKPAAEDESFALHSLQEQFDKNRRFKASKEQLLHFYEQMLLIRRFEERAGQLYGLGFIGVPLENRDMLLFRWRRSVAMRSARAKK